jgi:hypothetical protein
VACGADAAAAVDTHTQQRHGALLVPQSNATFAAEADAGTYPARSMLQKLPRNFSEAIIMVHQRELHTGQESFGERSIEGP